MKKLGLTGVYRCCICEDNDGVKSYKWGDLQHYRESVQDGKLYRPENVDEAKREGQEALDQAIQIFKKSCGR